MTGAATIRKSGPAANIVANIASASASAAVTESEHAARYLHETGHPRLTVPGLHSIGPWSVCDDVLICLCEGHRDHASLSQAKTRLALTWHVSLRGTGCWPNTLTGVLGVALCTAIY
jgi:hypothetical protein